MVQTPLTEDGYFYFTINIEGTMQRERIASQPKSTVYINEEAKDSRAQGPVYDEEYDEISEHDPDDDLRISWYSTRTPDAINFDTWPSLLYCALTLTGTWTHSGACGISRTIAALPPSLSAHGSFSNSAFNTTQMTLTSHDLSQHDHYKHLDRGETASQSETLADSTNRPDSVKTTNDGAGFVVFGCTVCHPHRTRAYHCAYAAVAMLTLLSNPVVNVSSMVKSDWGEDTATALDRISGLVNYVSWILLGLVFIAFQIAMLLYLGSPSHLIQTMAALRSCEEGTMHSQQDNRIMKSFNRRLVYSLVWGLFAGSFTVFYWLPYQAGPNWVKESHIHQVLQNQTGYILQMWAISQFFAFTTPSIMATLVWAIARGFKLRLNALATISERFNARRFIKKHHAIDDDLRRTSERLTPLLRLIFATCFLYMLFSLYAIVQTYRDESDSEGHDKVEVLITGYDVCVVAYVGFIVSTMLFHLSSIQPTSFELRGRLNNELARYDDYVDCELRTVVDYLATAEQFSAFKIGGWRVTRNIYMISWMMSGSTILINLLT